jgi:hypothetical protein
MKGGDARIADLAAAAETLGVRSSERSLGCIECASGHRWRAYLADDPCEDDPPEMAVFCPSCECELAALVGAGESLGEAVA